ncbi:MAG: MATE family efflux transporter [Bacteroidota bacterium]
MHREILRLAIPNILSNLTVPLLGIVDTALMGRLDGEAYIGAVALGSMLLNFVYWSFGFLRMGTTGLTAQAYGQEDVAEQATLIGRSLSVGVVSGLCIVLLQIPLVWIGFQLIPGEAEVLELARQYVLIRIWDAPATIGLYALIGWFLGMQNARLPLLLTILVNVVNIVGNLYFVLHLGMKADGVAWGTVLAQYTGFIAGLSLLFWRYRDLLRRLNTSILFKISGYRHFFAVNADMFVRTVLLLFVFAFFTAQGSGIDAMTLAANQILLQYFHTMAFGVDGFAFAAESLVGRFIGAKDATRLRQVVREIFMWGVGLGLVFTLIYLIAGEGLLTIFTDQVAVIAAARPYLPWMYAFPLAGAVAFMWDGIYVGATASRPMRNSMLIATFLVFLPLWYIATPIWGNHGLWLALLSLMVMRGGLLGIWAKKYVKV